MKDAFYIKIETMHFPDRGTQENVCTQPEYSHKSMVLETVCVHNQIITIRLKSIVLEALYVHNQNIVIRAQYSGQCMYSIRIYS